MKVSGFTLVRNGVKFDYPFIESIRSILPIVDEMIVNVGYGDDDTLQKVQSIGDPKIKIFQSDWQLDNPEKKRGGLILSEQTNLALDRCTSDWCIYIQADEVMHEEDLPTLRRAIENADSRKDIDGVLFDYVHFYGSFDVVQTSRSAYRREVRAIRKSSGARSVGDAQSFRKNENQKLHVIRPKTRIFHYGWVRPPEKMREKTFFMDTLYHGDPSAKQTTTGTPHTGDNYKYKRIIGLRRFKATHPQVMRERIANKNWKWDLENSPRVFGKSDFKKIILDSFERLTGHRLFEYRSYRLIR